MSFVVTCSSFLCVLCVSVVNLARVKIGNPGKLGLCALLKTTPQKHPKNAQK